MSDERETGESQAILKRELQRLPWLLTVERLESLLRQLGDAETELRGLPPLCAARRFRTAVRRVLRAGSVTRERVCQMLDDLAAEQQTARPDVTAPPRLAQHFERAFFIFGLRRGGNHAIAEWLKGHFDDRETLYLNDARPDVFETRGTQLKVDHAYYDNVATAAGQSVLLIGYENQNFLDFPFAHNARVAKRSDLIVVLRDYPNMVASIARSARERPAFVFTYRVQELPANWAAYARHLRARTGGFVYVKFNDWFSHAEYRQSLAAQLGLRFSDRGLNVVSAYGRGSSFDGLTRAGAGQSMDVLNRWAGMMDDDLFLFLLLAGEDNLALNQELFANFPFSREDVLARWRGRAQ